MAVTNVTEKLYLQTSECIDLLRKAQRPPVQKESSRIWSAYNALQFDPHVFYEIPDRCSVPGFRKQDSPYL